MAVCVHVCLWESECERIKRIQKPQTAHTHFYISYSLLFILNSSAPPFLSGASSLLSWPYRCPLNWWNWATIINWKHVWETTGAEDEDQKDWTFYYSPICNSGNKTKLVLLCCCSFTLGGYEVTSVQDSLLIHLKGFGALSSEIERLINVPATALGFKKKHTYTTLEVCMRACVCMCGRSIVGTICCTLSPHSHLFMWRESTNIIWIPIRLTLRVHTLHHHEASTVHCNLNPLFESYVCVCL